MIDKKFYLYRITNLLNGKIYVGVHYGRLEDSYMGSGTAIQLAIKKYGINNFKKDVVQVFETSEEMYDAENRIVNEDFIKRIDTYNITVGGFGSFHHINSNPEKKRLYSEIGIKTFMSRPKEEIREINKKKAHHGKNNYWFGKDRSGSNNPRHGAIVDQETRDKIRKSNKEKVERGEVDYSNLKGPITKEGKENISKANSRKFKFINPEGQIIELENLSKFCKENSLDECSMRHVDKGRNIQHKGWRRCV